MSKMWDWLFKVGYRPEKSKRRQEKDNSSAELPPSQGWPSADEPEAPYEPQYGEPEKRGTPPAAWEEGRHYFTHRGYTIPESDPSPGASLRAVDTHTEVTYAYCQAGHLHEYRNDVLTPATGFDLTQKSKHFPYGIPRTGPAIIRAFGWKDKTIKETPYCG